MNKQQWIKSQAQVLNTTNFNDLWSYLSTTLVEVENKDPRANVPKQLTILEATKDIANNDARLLMNEGAYESLLKNYALGDLESVALDIKRLLTTPEITQPTKDILNAILNAPPQTEPDPNWKPTKFVPMYVAAGFDSLALDEVVEALSL